MNREEFLAFQSVSIKKVHIKEMDCDMYVRSLSAAEKAGWEQQPYVEDVKAAGGIRLSRDRFRSARERLVEIAACNEDGSRYFKVGDSIALGRMNAKIISTLYDAATPLSGITKEDLDEIVKNSEGALDDDSTSASPTNIESL